MITANAIFRKYPTNFSGCLGIVMAAICEPFPLCLGKFTAEMALRRQFLITAGWTWGTWTLSLNKSYQSSSRFPQWISWDLCTESSWSL